MQPPRAAPPGALPAPGALRGLAAPRPPQSSQLSRQERGPAAAASPARAAAGPWHGQCQPVGPAGAPLHLLSPVPAGRWHGARGWQLQPVG